MSNNVPEPTGIPFYSVKTDETFHAKLEPTIAAMINSSDMGINASRGQDFGWRLAPEWVEKVRAFKRDQTKMSILTSKNSGQKPTTVQILYFIYEEQLRDYFESQEENDAPFEEKYRQQIAGQQAPANTEVETPTAPATPQDDTRDLIDDVLAQDESTQTETAPETTATETKTTTATRSQKKQ